MAIRGIDHIQLAMPVGGEEAARRFYEGLLGIPEVAKPPDLAARGGCWFESASVKVHLGVEATFTPARKAHPAFLVDDLPGLLQILSEAGFPASEDVAIAGWERRHVNDPFGNRIELMQPK